MHGERDATLVDESGQPPSPDATRRMAGAVHQELDELDGLAEELVLSLFLAREWDDAAAERLLDGQRRRLEEVENRLRQRLAEAVIEREAEAIVARAQHATDAAAGQGTPAARRMPATVMVAVLALVAALLAVGDVTPPLDYVVDQRAVEAHDPADLPDPGGRDPAATDHLAPIPNRDNRIPEESTAGTAGGDRGGSVDDGNTPRDADGRDDGQAEFLDPGDLVSGLVQERMITNLLEEMTELLAAGGDVQRELESDVGADRTAPRDDSDGSSGEPHDEADDQPTDRSGDEARDDDGEHGQHESTSDGDDDHDGRESDEQGEGDTGDDSDSTVSRDAVFGDLD